MNKKLIALLLSTAMVVSIAACGNSAQDVSSSALSEPETNSEATETTTATDESQSATTNVSTTDGYEDLFTNDVVHQVDVGISEEDWADLLANPTEKTKYATNVVIDGTEVDNVSFATKGNTSLTSVANMDSDRYSFKINFGKNEEGQTYKGLDKLNLNNTYSDKTYLKDYISYRIMAEAGVPAPLVSFVALSINGEYYGLYVAIEEVGDSFLERNYGEDAGELYKPEAEGLDAKEMPEGDFDPDNRPEMGAETDGTMPSFEEGEMPQMMDTAKGADLAYSDDSIESYSDIFDNAETDPEDEDMQRVIRALKTLNSGENVDTAINVQEVANYFAAHNFVLNFDSYTGNMLHNYYLYEEEGVLSILPWDYNLAFGAFSMGGGGGPMGGGGGPMGNPGQTASESSDATTAAVQTPADRTTSDDTQDTQRMPMTQEADATELVNWPIDDPLGQGVTAESRPLWNAIANNEDYLTIYHDSLNNLIENYFESGDFEKEMDAVYALIRPYVETDPSTFYTVEQFDQGFATLKDFCLLRAASIRGQLDGSIPSTSAGQEADSSSLISANELSISDMGTMEMGNNRSDADKDEASTATETAEAESTTADTTAQTK